MALVNGFVGRTDAVHEKWETKLTNGHVKPENGRVLMNGDVPLVRRSHNRKRNTFQRNDYANIVSLNICKI